MLENLFLEGIGMFFSILINDLHPARIPFRATTFAATCFKWRCATNYKPCEQHRSTPPKEKVKSIIIHSVSSSSLWAGLCSLHFEHIPSSQFLSYFNNLAPQHSLTFICLVVYLYNNHLLVFL